MTTNRKTRNRSNARRWRAEAPARKTRRDAEFFADEIAHEIAQSAPPLIGGSRNLYRSAYLTEGAITGSDKREILGAGKPGTDGYREPKGYIAQRSTDAAGPLREYVGCTATRGGELDYLAGNLPERTP